MTEWEITRAVNDLKNVARQDEAVLIGASVHGFRPRRGLAERAATC